MKPEDEERVRAIVREEIAARERYLLRSALEDLDAGIGWGKKHKRKKHRRNADG
jgi:hypothetical protein